MKKVNHYSIFIIGSDFYRIKQACYFPSVIDTPSFKEVDLILLGTSVEWKEDGRYSTDRIKKDLEILYTKGYYHQICLHHFMPLKEVTRLQCHYFPLEFLEKETNSLCFGLNPFLSFDSPLLRRLFLDIFKQPVQIMSLDRLEYQVLVQTCQDILLKSFYKEIQPLSNTLGKKDFKPLMYSSSNTTPETIGILTYIIRLFEDLYIDCPVLYSCLFHQKILNK